MVDGCRGLSDWAASHRPIDSRRASWGRSPSSSSSSSSKQRARGSSSSKCRRLRRSRKMPRALVAAAHQPQPLATGHAHGWRAVRPTACQQLLALRPAEEQRRHPDPRRRLHLRPPLLMSTALAWLHGALGLYRPPARRHRCPPRQRPRRRRRRRPPRALVRHLQRGLLSGPLDWQSAWSGIVQTRWRVRWLRCMHMDMDMGWAA